MEKQSYRLQKIVYSKGVRRLFSRGGQNFPGEGAKTYYLPKNTWKDTIFVKKVQKT